MEDMYKDFNVTGFELTSAALEFLIKTERPTAVHSRDFWVFQDSNLNVEPEGNAYILGWKLAGRPPTLEELTALAETHRNTWRTLSADRAMLANKNAIKGKAYRDIVAIMPEHKQRNNLARAVELLTNVVLNGHTPTSEEADELTAGMAKWAQIKVIRENSDEEEKALIK